MALKRRLKDGTIKLVTYKQESKDVKIKRLTDLVKELTDLLAQISGYDREIADVSTYAMYG
jgi:hypothetical protein